MWLYVTYKKCARLDPRNVSKDVMSNITFTKKSLVLSLYTYLNLATRNSDNIYNVMKLQFYFSGYDTYRFPNSHLYSPKPYSSRIAKILIHSCKQKKTDIFIIHGALHPNDNFLLTACWETCKWRAKRYINLLIIMYQDGRDDPVVGLFIFGSPSEMLIKPSAQ